MLILAIDPGPVKSAFVQYNAATESIGFFNILPNEDLLGMIPVLASALGVIALEMVASYGMPVGQEVFETVFWIGRYAEKAVSVKGSRIHRIKRKEVCMSLCHSTKASDANIRQALIDRLGAPGTKKSPGKTYGVHKDVWAALAVAVAVGDHFLPF